MGLDWTALIMIGILLRKNFGVGRQLLFATETYGKSAHKKYERHINLLLQRLIMQD